ncbi:hypothetical protein [Streptomyces murinus]|uniref:hypothetical protein n=1 Tax=Streptomyces murinus TaxID=33900 RepID=UPI003727458F
MELTQATVNDLLDRLGPVAGHLYLPGDLDPQTLTDLLDGKYGAPRTLVLDGFTDPTVDVGSSSVHAAVRSYGRHRSGPSRAGSAPRACARRRRGPSRPGR